MPQSIVIGAFDDIRSADIRFLDEASRVGPVTVRLLSDALIRERTGSAPKFPEAERRYFLESLRFVSRAVPAAGDGRDEPLPADSILVCRAADPANPAAAGVRTRIIPEAELRRMPKPSPCPENPRSERKKVIVTGCFDWFHTGHVRFFEEVSELGDLYAIVGHDQNIRLLKGEGHPLIGQDERCYVANAVRFAQMAMVSTGNGWLDAEPEIARLKPDIYAVNEDGDRPEKRRFCESHGIEYRVLKRLPKPGLEKRSSTDLRGF